MAKVLYVSYTGLMEPLGESQVLQYLLGLAGMGHSITLLTFEKGGNQTAAAHVSKLEAQCRSANITWKQLQYDRFPGLVGTFYNILVGTALAVKLARAANAEIIHARSYIPGLMAIVTRRASRAKLVFDMRGFWPDERVDGGIWSRNSLQYRASKWLERHLLRSSDHVVSLTQAGVREIRLLDYLADVDVATTVIPTCTNLELFHPAVTQPTRFTLGYVGSTGSWYMFEEVACAVRLLFASEPEARFLVVNRSDHARIRAILKAADVDLARVEMQAVPYDQVAQQIGRMSAGIFFIKPAFSKRASSPTRLGEFLACGKPCLSNSGVGDVKQDLEETRTGVVLDELSESTIAIGLRELTRLAEEPEIAARCRSAAENRFSLSYGIAKYDRVYREVLAE